MIKLHDMLLAGQAGVFTHDGEDFLMSCQKGSIVFFPVQTRLPATKIGWRGAIILLQLLLLYGTIKTDEPRTLDFSGVRGFLVTNMFIVQCSAAYNVHRFEPPLLTFQRP